MSRNKTLEDKLGEIIDYLTKTPFSMMRKTKQEVIAQIKECFAKENQAVRYGGYMSGEAWYRKFIKELSDERVNLELEIDALETSDVLKAAKRASQKQEKDET